MTKDKEILMFIEKDTLRWKGEAVMISGYEEVTRRRKSNAIQKDRGFVLLRLERMDYMMIAGPVMER